MARPTGFDRGGASPPAVALAIETSWTVGSVALALDGAVVSRRFLPERSRHGVRLVPAIAEVLEEAGQDLSRVEAVVAGSGPGSFTGVRIAAATAKGLAGALDVPLHAVSSLASAAVAAEVLAGAGPLPDELREAEDRGGWSPSADDRQLRYVLLDARRGRVYGACFEVGGGGPLKTRIQVHGGTVMDVLNRRPPAGTCFAGDGARVHASLIRAAGYSLLPLPAGVPSADGALAACSWEPVDRKTWEPEYVRDWSPGP